MIPKAGAISFGFCFLLAIGNPKAGKFSLVLNYVDDLQKRMATVF